MSENSIKLQSFIAHAGITSRRKAEELIADGKVQVNGVLAHLGQRIDPTHDKVSVEGQAIGQESEKVAYLIYKPAGYVSTTQDELGRKTVVDFLKKEAPTEDLPSHLYPVGRLDLDSEGLMILTNNGELTQKMTHPSFEVEKTYQITVEGLPSEKALAHLERGVLLHEGMTAPAHVEVVEYQRDHTVLEITIHEGRYHQVKRMLLRVGYPVVKLIRIKMGQFSLADLDGQSWKKLSSEETVEGQ
jgi:23S rRNA pseudouridine2605 synthase